MKYRLNQKYNVNEAVKSPLRRGDTEGCHSYRNIGIEVTTELDTRFSAPFSKFVTNR